MFTIWPFAKKKKKFANPSFTKKSIFYYLNSSKYLPRWISSRYLMTTFSYDHFKRVNYKPQYYVWLFSYQFQSHPGCFLLSRGIKVSLHKTCVLILDLEKKRVPTLKANYRACTICPMMEEVNLNRPKSCPVFWIGTHCGREGLRIVIELWEAVCS